jgi:hypothetical protein
MNREVHVRICGSREVKVLPATRPAEIISHCVWLYHRFPLSFREVEEMMLERGIVISHETIRQWCAKFGQTYANELRRRRARPGDKWHGAPRGVLSYPRFSREEFGGTFLGLMPYPEPKGIREQQHGSKPAVVSRRMGRCAEGPV